MTLTSNNIELHIPVEQPDQDAVQLLHAASGLSRQMIKQAMTHGAVWLTRGSASRRLRRAKRAPQPGDTLHLYFDPRVQAERPPEPALIADAGGYSVWRKPCGMRSQGSKWGDHCTIMRWAETHLQPERPSFTVHRLDLAANGLILIAHSKTVAAQLARLFSERLIDKQYRAIVHGDFSDQPQPLRITAPINDKAARSEISLLETAPDGRLSLVNVRIETGRKHQIRRHLADAGFPIVGDRLYGTATASSVDLQLTAWRLAFHCPVQDAEVIYVLPDEWLPVMDPATMPA